MVKILRYISVAIMVILMESLGFAQDTRVSISRQSATINSILDDIESQTDYLFIYRKGVNVMLTKSIDVREKPVSEVLKTLFAETGISYTTEGNYIVLTQTAPVALNKTVKGTVLDENGIPIVGAIVYAHRQKSYALTDTMGQYSIDLDRKDELQFSLIGYEPAEFGASPGQKLDVVLKEHFEIMQEAVSIGFGVQKRSDITGSIASIDSRSFEKRNVNNLSGSLVGLVSGVQTVSVSGDPGSVGEIRIRGLASNSSSSNSPLYVVDGLLVKNLGQIHPQNVEKIEIFKDAASAAIYGAQAGNGVVVITTKTGSSGNGRIFYDGSYRFESLGWRPKMMNAFEYSTFLRSSGLVTPGVVEENWNGITDTDWIGKMFPGGYARQHTFGMEGGNSKGDYFMSVSFLENDGILYGDKDRMNSMNAQFNASYRVKDWARIGSTNALQYKKSSAEIGSFGGGDKSVMALAYGMSPLLPMTYTRNDMPEYMRAYFDKGYPLIKIPTGEYASTTTISSSMINPLARLYRYPDSVNEYLATYGTVFLDLTPVKPLKFTSRLGYNISAKYKSRYEEPWYVGEQEYNTEYNLSSSLDWQFRYQWDNFVNADFLVGGVHDIDLMAGMSYMEDNGRYSSGSTNNLKDYLPNFRFLDFSTVDAVDKVGGLVSRQAALSYFTRVGYDYDDRYFLQFSLRADAFDTSRLSRLSRWGYFPSVSFGWNITNEPWMENADKSVLSFLKLRSSWGINGNIGVLSDYEYAATVTVGGSEYALGTDGTLTQASYPSKLANDELKWEESEQFDLGFDARFFRSRLSVTADYYSKLNRDLLVSVTPSYTTGQSSVYMNAGSVRNRGAEFELSWKDSMGAFIYSIDANLSRNRNMVMDLAKSITRIGGAEIDNGHKCTYFQQGYPIWYMYGYVYDGVDPDTGNGIYRDMDGDGKITTSDMTMVGCAQPDFTYGLSLMAEYKGVDFILSGSGSQGNDIWFAGLRTNHLKNLPEVFYDRAWKYPGDVTRYPRFSQALTSSYLRSSACVYDGSYFRINQIQIGYSLPDRIIDKVNVDRIRLFLSVDDYFTFSRYIGFDPVTAGDDVSSGNGIDRGSYPTPRKLTIGVNISL